ncbi:hypothetical protein [Pseudonocardia sp. ICBG1034]|uniref:hypothetical protein n=1 Tax=Pseudonocardia sp. ICBG1034 TaxID=2844381 RepID=UPI001CCBD9D6|nr:hypothetical protein [Pseudonocardia sp. ICBG1034]
MTAFDPRAYEDAVLKPLRRSMPHLPDDLPGRYAVESGMDDAAVKARVDSVVRLWNKHALKTGSPIGMVAQLLLREHEKHVSAGDALTTAAFWRSHAAQREARLGGAVAEVAEQLDDMYAPLGVLTAGQLRAVAAGHTALTEADVERARDTAGLRVVEPVELPTSGVMRGRPETLANALARAGVGSVAQLLVPDLTSFEIVAGLTVAGRPLAGGAVTGRALELEKRPDSPEVRAQKEAVGLLATETKAGSDLTRIALVLLLAPVRTKRAEGAPPRVLFAMLTAARLGKDDAALLAVSVFAESGSPVRDPAGVVHELLAEGRLVAAEQAAAALAGDDGEQARAAARRQRSSVEDLRERARQALRSGREDEAGSLLGQALGLAVDLPGLAEEAGAVPAAPVLAVSAAAAGTGVRISWRPAPGHRPDTEFAAVRGTGRAPADPGDGVALPGTGAGPVTDTAPPVGRPLHYAVFARTPGGRWSRPCTAEAWVVPPVGDLRVEGGNGVVTGRWTLHPDAIGVDVRRTEVSASGGRGDPVPVERDRGFRDTGAVDGVRYRYSVVACYRATDGTVLRSEPVATNGATRLAAKPVPTMQANSVTGDGLALRLSWQTRPGSDVVVRRADVPCPWEYGATVPLDRLSGWGRELGGDLTERGRSTVLTAPVPPGRSYCVAFTVGTGEAVRGAEQVVDLTDPVRRVQAQRFGDDVQVTWLWPDAVAEAEVLWPGGRRRITVTQYRNEGGCLLRGVPDVRRVEVGALVLGGIGDETRAPAVSVEVDDRPPRLGYRLHRSGNRMFGGLRCTVTFDADVPVPGVEVVLVGASGRVMPRDADAGVEILRRQVAVTPGVPLTLPEVTLPPVLRKPFWLRCFLVDPGTALLVDPPVSQMKVS